MSPIIGYRPAPGETDNMDRRDKQSDNSAAGLSRWRCPGVFREIEFAACPSCGEEVEFFPQDRVRPCPACGAQVGHISGSCLSYCPARESDCFRQTVRSRVLSEMKNGEPK
ncbi:MAG: zinc ribbon-containing protein [Actinobacteria bacterium]|nr:zinc ribbon-containing protein [Actinomycetota bacterium]